MATRKRVSSKRVKITSIRLGADRDGRNEPLIAKAITIPSSRKRKAVTKKGKTFKRTTRRMKRG